MTINEIQVSPMFRRQTFNAVLSIIFFVIIYMIILSMAACLALLSSYYGIELIVSHPGLYTLIAGLGLMSVGVFVFYKNVFFMVASRRCS